MDDFSMNFTNNSANNAQQNFSSSGSSDIEHSTMNIAYVGLSDEKPKTLDDVKPAFEDKSFQDKLKDDTNKLENALKDVFGESNNLFAITDYGAKTKSENILANAKTFLNSIDNLDTLKQNALDVDIKMEQVFENSKSDIKSAGIDIDGDKYNLNVEGKEISIDKEAAIYIGALQADVEEKNEKLTFELHEENGEIIIDVKSVNEESETTDIDSLKYDKSNNTLSSDKMEQNISSLKEVDADFADKIDQLQNALKNNNDLKDKIDNIRTCSNTLEHKIDKEKTISTKIDDLIDDYNSKQIYSSRNSFRTYANYKLIKAAYKNNIPINGKYVTFTDVVMAFEADRNSNIFDTAIECLILKIIDGIETRKELEEYHQNGFVTKEDKSIKDVERNENVITKDDNDKITVGNISVEDKEYSVDRTTGKEYLGNNSDKIELTAKNPDVKEDVRVLKDGAVSKTQSIKAFGVDIFKVTSVDKKDPKVTSNVVRIDKDTDTIIVKIQAPVSEVEKSVSAKDSQNFKDAVDKSKNCTVGFLAVTKDKAEFVSFDKIGTKVDNADLNKFEQAAKDFGKETLDQFKIIGAEKVVDGFKEQLSSRIETLEAVKDGVDDDKKDKIEKEIDSLKNSLDNIEKIDLTPDKDNPDKVEKNSSDAFGKVSAEQNAVKDKVSVKDKDFEKAQDKRADKISSYKGALEKAEQDKDSKDKKIEITDKNGNKETLSKDELKSKIKDLEKAQVKFSDLSVGDKATLNKLIDKEGSIKKDTIDNSDKVKQLTGREIERKGKVNDFVDKIKASPDVEVKSVDVDKDLKAEQNVEKQENNNVEKTEKQQVSKPEANESVSKEDNFKIGNIELNKHDNSIVIDRNDNKLHLNDKNGVEVNNTGVSKDGKIQYFNVEAKGVEIVSGKIDSGRISTFSNVVKDINGNDVSNDKMVVAIKVMPNMISKAEISDSYLKSALSEKGKMTIGYAVFDKDNKVSLLGMDFKDINGKASDIDKDNYKFDAKQQNVIENGVNDTTRDNMFCKILEKIEPKVTMLKDPVEHRTTELVSLKAGIDKNNTATISKYETAVDNLRDVASKIDNIGKGSISDRIENICAVLSKYDSAIAKVDNEDKDKIETIKNDFERRIDDVQAKMAIADKAESNNDVAYVRVKEDVVSKPQLRVEINYDRRVIVNLSDMDKDDKVSLRQILADNSDKTDTEIKDIISKTDFNDKESVDKCVDRMFEKDDSKIDLIESKEYTTEDVNKVETLKDNLDKMDPVENRSVEIEFEHNVANAEKEYTQYHDIDAYKTSLTEAAEKAGFVVDKDTMDVFDKKEIESKAEAINNSDAVSDDDKAKIQDIVANEKYSDIDTKIQDICDKNNLEIEKNDDGDFEVSEKTNAPDNVDTPEPDDTAKEPDNVDNNNEPDAVSEPDDVDNNPDNTDTPEPDDTAKEPDDIDNNNEPDAVSEPDDVDNNPDNTDTPEPDDTVKEPDNVDNNSEPDAVSEPDDVDNNPDNTDSPEPDDTAKEPDDIDNNNEPDKDTSDSDIITKCLEIYDPDKIDADDKSKEYSILTVFGDFCEKYFESPAISDKEKATLHDFMDDHVLKDDVPVKDIAGFMVELAENHTLDINIERGTVNIDDPPDGFIAYDAYGNIMPESVYLFGNEKDFSSNVELSDFLDNYKEYDATGTESEIDYTSAVGACLDFLVDNNLNIENSFDKINLILNEQMIDSGCVSKTYEEFINLVESYGDKISDEDKTFMYDTTLDGLDQVFSFIYQDVTNDKNDVEKEQDHVSVRETVKDDIVSITAALLPNTGDSQKQETLDKINTTIQDCNTPGANGKLFYERTSCIIDIIKTAVDKSFTDNADIFKTIDINLEKGVEGIDNIIENKSDIEIATNDMEYDKDPVEKDDTDDPVD